MPVPLSSIVRRRSRISGWGVYTKAPISKNTRIIHYAGELISNKESIKRQQRQVGRGEIWCFMVTQRKVRDAEVGGNIARFLNHSCTGNCWIEIDRSTDTIWIRAARNIRKGEELTYDYSTDGEATIQCKCRPGCKTML